MILRPLTSLDAESLAELHTHVVHPWEKAWSAREFFDLLHQPSIHCLSVWDETCKNQPLKSFLLYQQCDVIDIIYLATHPRSQKRGLASSLLHHLIEKRMPITLDVCERNDNALRMYKKFGFHPIHIRKNYYKTQSHAYNSVMFYLNCIIT